MIEVLIRILSILVVNSALDPSEQREIQNAFEELRKLAKSKTGKKIMDYITNHGNLPGTPESRAAAEASENNNG